MKLSVLGLFSAVVAAFELRGLHRAAGSSQANGSLPFSAADETAQSSTTEDILADQIRSAVRHARARGPVGAATTDNVLADQIREAVQHARAKGPVGAATTDDSLSDQILTAVQHAKGSPVAAATTDEIMAEVKFRVIVCGKSDGPLAGVTLDDLFEELKKREAAKKCDDAQGAAVATAGAGGDAAATAAAAAGDAGAAAEEVAATTTTTTPPCPDNFMDEIIDQANPEFDRFDTNKDGCLEDGELTTSLRRQIEMARHRDYYWIRRNITNAARRLIKEGEETHAAADQNDSGCLNRQELDVIHHAICDCPTQFMFMDHNADGKISQQEAATFVSEHMPQADIDYRTLKKIFDAADVDANRYLSQKEFCEAGPRYQGDGPSAGVVKSWLPAPAPGPAPAF